MKTKEIPTQPKGIVQTIVWFFVFYFKHAMIMLSVLLFFILIAIIFLYLNFSYSKKEGLQFGKDTVPIFDKLDKRKK